MTAVDSSSTFLCPTRSPSRARSGTQSAETISCAASNQLTSPSEIARWSAMLREDRRVVALQHAAGDLDADQEADDRGQPVDRPDRSRARRSAVISGSSRSGAGTSATPASEVVDARCARRRSGWPRAAPWSSGTARTGRRGRRSAVKKRRVGGGHHHVRRGDGVGEDLGDRRLQQARTPRRRRTARPGSARWPRRPRCRTWSSPIGRAHVVDHAGDGVADHDPDVDAGAWRSLAITLRAGEPDSVVTATVVRVIAADSGPAGEQGAGEQRAEPVGVGHQRRAAARGACGASRRSSSSVGRRRARRERRALEPEDRPGEPGGRAVAGRGARRGRRGPRR